MSEATTSTAQSSDDFERRFQTLSSENWRERKDAIHELCGYLRATGVRERANAIERLIAGIEQPVNMIARAACQETLTLLGRVCLPSLLERIERGGKGQRLLIDLLVELGSSADLPVILDIVRSPTQDENARAAAATVLGRVGGAKAVSALISLMRQDSDMLRMYALDGLRAAGAQLDYTTLEPYLQQPITRKAALAVLGGPPDLAAAEYVAGALTDRMAGVRAMAVVCLRNMLATRDEGGGVWAEVVAHLEGLGEAVVRHLVALGDHDNLEVAKAALQVATHLKTSALLGVAMRRLPEPQCFDVVMKYVAALGDAVVPQLVELIPHSVRDDHETYLRLVAATQTRKTDARIAAFAVERVRSEDEVEVCAACRALERMGDASAVDALLERCARDDRPGEYASRALASIMLREQGDASPAIRRLRERLSKVSGDTDTGSMRNLCRVIALVGDVSTSPYALEASRAADPRVRVAALDALTALTCPVDCHARLCELIRDDAVEVRVAACRAMAQVPEETAGPCLLTATHDREARVRAAATAALVEMRASACSAVLRDLIARDDSPSVVLQAIAGLGRAGDDPECDRDRELLAELCASPDTEIVKAAARALAGAAHARATLDLIELLKHEKWDVRWTAVESLALRPDAKARAALEELRPLESDALVRDALTRALARAPDDPENPGARGGQTG